MMKNRAIPLLLLLTSFIWGTSFVATEMVLREASVLTTLLLRLGLAALVLGGALAARRRPLPERRHLADLVALGLLSTSLYQLVQVSANRLAHASITSLFVSMHPIALALFGALFFREKLGGRRISGILLGLFGSVYVATAGTFALKGNLRLGAALLLLLLNSFMWASYSSLSRRLRDRFTPFELIAWMTLIGFLFFLPAALLLARLQGVDVGGELARLSARAWAAGAYLALFCTVLAYALWIHCLRRTDMAKAGYYLYLEPLFTMAVAPLFVGNQASGSMLVGGGFIFLGLGLVSARLPRRRA